MKQRQGQSSGLMVGGGGHKIVVVKLALEAKKEPKGTGSPVEAIKVPRQAISRQISAHTGRNTQ